MPGSKNMYNAGQSCRARVSPCKLDTNALRMSVVAARTAYLFRQSVARAYNDQRQLTEKRVHGS